MQEEKVRVEENNSKNNETMLSNAHLCAWPQWGRKIPKYLEFRGTSLVAQTVKRLPAMQETWVRSLGREHLLEEEMATYSSTLAWKIPWTEEPGRLQSMGLQRVGHDWATSLFGGGGGEQLISSISQFKLRCDHSTDWANATNSMHLFFVFSTRIFYLLRLKLLLDRDSHIRALLPLCFALLCSFPPYKPPWSCLTIWIFSTG